jgi:hypothetical protein
VTADLVCVLVDFPCKKPQSRKLKDQNAELSRKFGIEGYPNIIILSPEGGWLAERGIRTVERGNRSIN